MLVIYVYTGMRSCATIYSHTTNSQESTRSLDGLRYWVSTTLEDNAPGKECQLASGSNRLDSVDITPSSNGTASVAKR